MFTIPTVFILGAGASWHYGYPTGEQLVDEVVKRAIVAINFFRASRDNNSIHRPDYISRNGPEGPSNEERRAQWQAGLEDCEELARRLRHANPVVIDYFLGHNPHLQPIGKLMVAWVILECEARYRLVRMNENRTPPVRNKDNWCRFIIHELLNGCRSASDLEENQVKFVTFNYDVSLEDALYHGLRSIRLVEDSVTKFIDRGRIFHIYGQVRKLPSLDAVVNFDATAPNAFTNKFGGDYNKYCFAYKEFLDSVYSASQNLKVIDPDDKHTDQLDTARAVVESARCVYILGYGFDRNNNERIGLGQSLKQRGNNKLIFFTNFNDINRINKAASRLFLGALGRIPFRGSPGPWRIER